MALALLGLVLALLPVGCDSNDKQSNVDVKVQPAKEVAPSGPIEKLAAPESVLAFGGSDDMKTLLPELAKLAGPAGAQLQAKQVAKLVAARLELTDPSVVALDKPMRFVVVDPKAHDNGAVILMSTTGRDAFVAAMPKNKKQNDAGNAYSFQSPTQSTTGFSTYVNFVDDVAVMSPNKDLFSKYKVFLLKLAGATVASGASVVIAAKHAAKLYQSEIDEAVAEAKAEGAESPGAPAVFAEMGKMAQWAAGVAKDIDKVIIRIDALDDGGKVAIDVSAKDQSGLQKTFRSVGERKLSLLSKVPADATAVVAMNVDPDSQDELTRSLTAWSLQLSLGQDADSKYSDAMNDYWKATSGEMVFAAHRVPNGEGLRFSALMGIRDAEAARKAQQTLRGMLQQPKLQQSYAAMGMKLSVQSPAYKIGDVPVSTVTAEVDRDAKPSAQSVHRALGNSAPLYTKLMSSHIAIGPELGVMAYGDEARASIETWLGGKMPGGFDKAPGLTRALSHAAKGMFMLAYGSPTELIKQSLGSQLPQLGGPPTQDNGIAISAGATDGVLHIVVDMPAAQALALAKAMTTLGGL